jgi:peptidoglycan/LPS O-acetylase OafA/YrhL
MLADWPQKHTGKLEGLQVLRAVAALLVVWCHLKSNLVASPASNLPDNWLSTEVGAIGVDIFFVISGFVIALTAEKLGNDWRTFLAHRAARIVPVYYLISTYLLLIMLAGSLYRTNSSSVLNNLTFNNLFNTYGFIPLFDRTTYSNPLCTNGWTLSFEIWFYLCFAGLMRYRGGRTAGKYLPLILSAGVALALIFYHGTWFLPKFLFNPMVLEFCAGCLLYHARNRIGLRILYVMLVWLPLSLFFVNRTYLLGDNVTILANPVSALWRAAIWGSFAACLIGIVTQIDLKHAPRWPKVLLLIGDASYSIYLLGPVIMWTLMGMIVRLNKLMGHTYIVLSPLLGSVIYLLGTVLGGIILWKYFEVPVTKRAKQYLVRLASKAKPITPPPSPANI